MKSTTSKKNINQMTSKELLSVIERWDSLPESAKVAKSKNIKFFYPKKPCAHRHCVPYRTSNYTCLLCDTSPERLKRLRDNHNANKGIRNALYRARYHLLNKDKADGRVATKSPEEQLLEIAKTSGSLPAAENYLIQHQSKKKQIKENIKDYPQYFIGKLCAHGHSIRRVSNGKCFSCKSINDRKQYYKDPVIAKTKKKSRDFFNEKKYEQN